MGRTKSKLEKVKEYESWIVENTDAQHIEDCGGCGRKKDDRVDECVTCNILEESKMSTANETAMTEARATNGVMGLTKATVKALDSAVAEVHRLKAQGATTVWDLGHHIAKMYNDQLYKARVDEDGSPIYKHWNSFCQRELGMSPTNANQMMDIAKAYDRKHVLEYGTTKLGLALKVPEEDRPALLEVAGKRSKREFEAEVKKAREKAGISRKPARDGKNRGAGKSGAEGGGRAKTVKAEGRDKITVAAILQTHTIPLYKCPEKKGAEITEQPRAKRLADQPVGYFDLANGVRGFLKVSATATGELQVKMSLKRFEEPAA